MVCLDKSAAYVHRIYRFCMNREQTNTRACANTYTYKHTEEGEEEEEGGGGEEEEEEEEGGGEGGYMASDHSDKDRKPAATTTWATLSD